jgi:hypothetical protein
MDFDTLFSFVSLSTDWLIIIGIALAAAFAAYTVGTTRAVAFALAMPLSVFALPLIGETAFVGSLTSQLSTPIFAAAVWAALFALLFLLIRRMTRTYSDGSGRILQAIIAGAACAIILVTSWIQVAALSAVWEFGTAVSGVFGPPYLLLWLLGAFAALAFIRR